ncbi:crotonase/enoyl-CoA hydratase family protein [Brevibacterium ihuae]|uniref:crotonase/enoyl-CoA hydratase family protein n=1 Tax=Brevibacterium ihuae TaxID=1631743 RepID=UPI000C783460|nr:crotonase/enoyl-CoA hydratase family protein [Brevibacterium ihuae]
MSEYTHITYEVSEQIATVTIDSPQTKNAFTALMGQELIAAFRTADADDGVKVVVFTGKGRFFCPGADLSGGANTFDYDARESAAVDVAGDGGETIEGVRRDGGGRVSLAIAAMRKPVIVAFNGAGVGVGSTMTLPCDIRIASEDAKFGFVFAKRGIMPEAASTWFLPRVVGINRALEWVYTGRVFGPQEALEAGLVSRVVPAGDLMDTTYAVARELVEGSSALTMAAGRKMLWGMLGADSPWEAHRLDSRGIYELGRMSDAKEGVTSFLEKRPPEFPARIPADYPEWLPDFPGPQPVE